MQEIKYNGHVVELQDSIQELPFDRFIDFQRHLLAAANIGSTVEDVDIRVNRITGFLNRKESDKATIEAQNLRLTLRSAIAGLSPQMTAFAVLVESIDGNAVTDHSEAGLKRIVLQLKSTKLTWASAMKWIENVKKKSKLKWGLFSQKHAGKQAWMTSK